LEWSGVPESARGLALIVEDPDAPMGTFSHWVVVNLSPQAKGLKVGVPAEAVVPAASVVAAGDVSPTAAARQGKNDFGKLGYGGPCPPSGTHHYVFRLYALDAPIKIDTESPARSDVLKAIKGHIIAEGRLVGQYARSK
jgi:Raf kinase inhibitor-like YbhB/YbcL family protein